MSFALRATLMHSLHVYRRNERKREEDTKARNHSAFICSLGCFHISDHHDLSFDLRVIGCFPCSLCRRAHRNSRASIY